MKNYSDEFIEATTRTKKLGLPLPSKMEYTSNNFLDSPIFENKLVKFCQTHSPTFSVDQISAQCIKVHFEFKEKLEEILNIPIYYTIGYIQFNDEVMFHQSEASLKKLLTEGINENTINLHTWLTLPSMEILDFTLPTTLGKVSGNKEMYGKTIIKHPSKLTNGMEYHPLIVGEEFLYKIGAIQFQYD